MLRRILMMALCALLLLSAMPVFAAGGSVNGDEEAAKPTISIIGSPTIVLHQGNPYQEQGATAYDAREGDLSHLVVISGRVDVETAGTYTVVYSVVNEKGLAATAERRVQIVAPAEIRERQPYQFADEIGKKDVGVTREYTFHAEADGDMDLMLALSGGIAALSLRSADGTEVFRGEFASGAAQTLHGFAAGDYTLSVTAAQVSSTLSYTVNLLMPETIYIIFGAEEIPLGDSPLRDDILPALLTLAVVLAAGGLIIFILRKRKAAEDK